MIDEDNINLIEWEQNGKALIATTDQIIEFARHVVNRPYCAEADEKIDDFNDAMEKAYIKAGGNANHQGWSAILDGALDGAIEALNEGKDPVKEIERQGSLSYEEWISN